MSDDPGVVVTLREIYERQQATEEKLDSVLVAVEQLVAVNKRLDHHHDWLNDHGSRLSVLETAQAVAAAQIRPRAPWYSVVGAIVGIIAGVTGLVTLISIASKLGALPG